GAIYGGDNSTIELNGNGSVTFSENWAYGDGGAIYGSTIELSGNESVTFSGNTADFGGAIYGYGSTIELSGNESVTFSGNTADFGGAIYGDYGDITLSENGSVEFSGNTAFYGYGGAIDGGTITLSGNGSVTFSGNTASSSYNDTHGGAIDGGTITLSGNGSVTFSGNTASSTDSYAYGGAIYGYGNLNIRNNDSVLFEKNAEISGATYRLSSIYAGGSGDVISLSASAGKSIEFRDSVYIDSGSTVELNADYTDAEGVMHKQAGDIIFTGKYTEQHLNELLAADGLNRTATEAEILNSRTTEVHTMTNLYGGRLRVEDGAIYKGNGITVHEGSAATVLLKDAELSHTGYGITFNAGTTLELSGHNTITAAHLNMEDGSIMSFRMDKDNAAEGALTYTGNFNMGNKLVLNLNLDSNMASSGRTALMTFANGPDAGNWKAEHVVVNDLSGKGYGATELLWDGNTLYLSHAKLDDNGTADWEGGDGRWDGISGNWGQGDNMFSFTGQVDLFFGDKGSGTITIAGSFSTGDIHVNNSEGNDYHWKNDDKHAGCLHGDHSFHKEGKGDLTVDVELSYTGTTQVDGGTLTLNGSADLTGTFSNNGKLVINGSTTLGGDYEGSGDIEITGKLKLDKHDIEIGKGKDKDKADVHNNGKGNDDNIFSADNEDYEIKNGHVVAKGQNGNNGNNGLHLGNKLTDTSVENAGEETLVITHGENSLNGVHANKGNVEVYGKDKHRLQDITISGNLSVSFMTTGWEEGIDEYREAEISIFGTADFESNAILIADLILESGCKLTMDGAVHMGSDVTLNLGTTLNGRLYEDALNLAHAGEYVVLFDSVDSLILNNGTTSITYAPGELTLEDGVAANIYFTNLGEDSNIYITFVPGDTPVGGGTGTTGGEIRLTLGKGSDSDAVPEPSTSILSLLALAALAARRRRK
ncbi:MAG: PEP-CTERM sorting domain-containing protein, partial [Akkermansiaceae bacterium]|nr:PEP-CTERM sorting domain-containing protein [Akkermansiaceae bacterium]